MNKALTLAMTFHIKIQNPQCQLRAKRKEKITFNSERPKESFQGVRRARILHEKTR
jgi:hypothetical protein